MAKYERTPEIITRQQAAIDETNAAHRAVRQAIQETMKNFPNHRCESWSIRIERIHPYGHNNQIGIANPKHYRSTNEVGIYIHYDENNQILYVGKGTRLRANTRTGRRHEKKIHHIRFRRCKSHADAYVLEAMLIRKHRPPYNITGVLR